MTAKERHKSNDPRNCLLRVLRWRRLRLVVVLIDVTVL